MSREAWDGGVIYPVLAREILRLAEEVERLKGQVAVAECGSGLAALVLAERARIARNLEDMMAAMPISPDPRVYETDEDWKILLRSFIERNLGIAPEIDAGADAEGARIRRELVAVLDEQEAWVRERGGIPSATLRLREALDRIVPGEG